MSPTKPKPVAGIVLGLALTASAGCSSVMPYESDFQCKNSDYGKCIHPEDAYAEAIDATVPDARDDKASVSRGAGQRAEGAVISAAASGYDGYSDAVYAQLAAIVEAPVTPMVAPAKTIRTLILPYADDKREQRLYMPRYVYSVLEQPKFVLGDYLHNARHDFAGALAEGLLTGPDEGHGLQTTSDPASAAAPSKSVADAKER